MITGTRFMYSVKNVVIHRQSTLSVTKSEIMECTGMILECVAHHRGVAISSSGGGDQYCVCERHFIKSKGGAAGAMKVGLRLSSVSR
jgi:hypothetical protein